MTLKEVKAIAKERNLKVTNTKKAEIIAGKHEAYVFIGHFHYKRVFILVFAGFKY
jgi:hypothetical protein